MIPYLSKSVNTVETCLVCFHLVVKQYMFWGWTFSNRLRYEIVNLAFMLHFLLLWSASSERHFWLLLKYVICALSWNFVLSNYDFISKSAKWHFTHEIIWHSQPSLYKVKRSQMVFIESVSNFLYVLVSVFLFE